MNAVNYFRWHMSVVLFAYVCRLSFTALEDRSLLQLGK